MTMGAVGNMKRNGVNLLEKLLGEKIESDRADVRTQELLRLLDLLFQQASFNEESSTVDITNKLGEDAVNLIVKMYQREMSDGAESMTVSSVSSSDDESGAEATKSGKYKKETEIAVSRIFSLGSVVPPLDTSKAPFDPYDGPRVVTMTGFGELGRFGNQLIQYIFLKCYASQVDAEVQVPYWVGKDLFGLTDEPVQRALPAVVETRETKANSTFTDEFLEYIVRSNEGRDVPEILPSNLSGNVQDLPVNVDVWGWFQWHTSNYKSFKPMIQKLLEPIPALRTHFDSLINQKLRQGGKRTVVGCHLRLGDYKNIAASSFGYVAPTEWYLEWLEKLWPTLENPVLFVASDEVDTVLRDFAKFNPVTAESLGVNMPKSFDHLDAGMFPDWYILSQCDYLAISNSTFSFSACLANTRPNARFFRAHYADKIAEIDPWDAEVIVHRDMNKSAVATGVDTLRIVYNTQGTKALLQNIFFELPYYGVRNIIMKAVLKRKQLFASGASTMKELPKVAAA